MNISRCVLGVVGSGTVLNVTGVGQGWVIARVEEMYQVGDKRAIATQVDRVKF